MERTVQHPRALPTGISTTLELAKRLMSQGTLRCFRLKKVEKKHITKKSLVIMRNSQNNNRNNT